MPDIPDAAVRAALAAYANALYDRPDPTVLSDETLIRIVLEAAGPALGDYAAQKITRHMEEHERPLPPNSKVADTLNRQARRRHFRTAAQIAARAFMTDEDLKRAAAAALISGGYIACPSLETREDETRG